MKSKKFVKKYVITGIVTLGMVVGPLASASFACTSVLVGKKASVDGSVMIARNEDAQTAWAKHLIVHPRTINKAGEVFKSTGNNFEYQLPAVSYKYTATPDWDTSEGQFEEAGINEYEVAVSATETTDANDKAKAADPFDENKGITECSIPSVLLPSIQTARQGVQLIGDIIEKTGAGESFGFAIADQNEAWYIESGSGHHWAAVRVPDDSYMIVANQLRIGKVDLKDNNNYMGSKDLISFAIDRGLYDSNKDGEFNFAKVYGTDTNNDLAYNYPRVWWGELILTPSQKQEPGMNNYPLFMKPDKQIALKDVMAVLRSHYDGSPYDSYNFAPAPYTIKNPRPISINTTMESHVLQLRSGLPAAIGGVHWLSFGIPETSVYIPFYAGINDTPAAYKMGSDAYDKDSAYWAFRSVNSLVYVDFKNYSGLVIPAWQNFEQKEFQQQGNVDATALKLFKENPQKCSEYLTNYSNSLASEALDKSNNILSNIITKTTKLKVPINTQ